MHLFSRYSAENLKQDIINSPEWALKVVQNLLLSVQKGIVKSIDNIVADIQKIPEKAANAAEKKVKELSGTYSFPIYLYHYTNHDASCN